MKNSKKIISLALCLTLVFSVFACLGAFTASAVGTEASGKRDLDSDGTYWYSDTKVSTYTSGTGTAGDPYIITTAAQLRHLARGNTGGGGKYYKLGCDIVINDSTNQYWYEETGLKNWIKGSDSTYGTFSDARNYRELGGELFRDTFDGDGHTISGLYINYSGTGTMAGAVSSRVYCGWGLFPCTYGATFKNVKLKDVYIKSNVTASGATTHYHGYGGLVGIVHSSQPTTFQNVQVENVKFDITKPNLNTAGKPVGVGGIIGYAYGNLNVTDAVVKNVTAKLTNWYATSRCAAYIGAITGAMGWGATATLTNVITVGKMNPMSCSSMTSGGAVSISSGNAIQDIKSGLSVAISGTNCYAIGAEQVFADSGTTLVADEATFLSSYLDTFYANKGASTNWAAKKTGALPTLASFPKTYGAVLKCDFSNYTTKADYANSPNADTNWTIQNDAESGNKYLQGDLRNILALQDYSFTLTPNYAIGNNSNHTGYYQWGMNGVLEPGTVYKLDFKAKADAALAMKFAIYSGYGFAAGYNNRGEHLVGEVLDEYGRRIVNLTTGWQNYSIYFTAEYFPNNESQGTNRPVFQIHPGAVGGHYVYFDDIVLSTVNGVSFEDDDNHYLQPCIGNDGDAITLPETPVRDGYIFGGWYTDEDRLTALDNSAKIGDVPVLYAKWDAIYASHSLVLTDAIGINFHMNLSGLTEEEKAGSYMTFDVTNYDTTLQDEFDSTDVNAGGKYCFTCFLSSVQMAETVTPTLHYGDGETMTGAGFSVKDYIDYVVANSGSFDSTVVDLVKALGDYGHYMQIYLGNKNEWTAGTNYTAIAKYRATDYTSEQHTAYLNELNTNNVAMSKEITGSAVTAVSYNLNFDSSTYINVKMTTADTITASAVVNEVPLTVAGSGQVQLRTRGLPIIKLGETFTVSGLGTENTTPFTVTLSGLSYIRATLKKESELIEGSKDAVSALYGYYRAARVYHTMVTGGNNGNLNGETVNE